MGANQMIELASQARSLGFKRIGVTGGEPFLVREMPETLARLAQILPVLVLSNGTLFDTSGLDRLDPLVGAPVKIQISLDRPDPDPNDAMRGPKNFSKVVEAIPRLLNKGIGVRIATTLESVDEQELGRLCLLHRKLGVCDEDHVVRPVVRRGRAQTNSMGVAAGVEDLHPELTITADGAFWSPFAPTVTDGRLDTDMLLTRTTDPLDVPARVMLGVVEGRTAGEDTTLGIR